MASDWRRVSGTIRAPLVDNGATHLESYIRARIIPGLCVRGVAVPRHEDGIVVFTLFAVGERRHVIVVDLRRGDRIAVAVYDVVVLRLIPTPQRGEILYCAKSGAG